MSVREASVQYHEYQHIRDPFFDEYKKEWKFGAKFNLNLYLTPWLLFDNSFVMRHDDTQIRQGGWEYNIRLRPCSHFELFKYHESLHSFDERQERRFPVTDAYGVKVYFINNK